MPTPQTAAQWWALLDSDWNNILGLFEKVGAKLDGYDAAFAESLDEPLQVYLERLRHTESPFIVGNLMRVWQASPDHLVVRTWPGFNTLCELLSSAEVIDTQVCRTYHRRSEVV